MFSLHGRGRLAAALLAAILCPPVASADAPLDTAAVDKVVQDSLKTWKVPGAALAIVQNDRVVYLKGYGVRDLGDLGDRGGQRRAQPVTADTVFGIASLTKAFTTTAMAMLVDDGKLKWDDPVRKHIEYFRLADPLADRDVTLRDLVCHRTGISGHDLLWLGAPWSQEETVRRLAFVKPHTSFRSTYEYNNIMFMAAGLAVASASRSPWHEFVRKRIFDPLGMKGAVFTRSEALKAADRATPHRRGRDGTVRALPWYEDDKQIRASGSIKASARDLAQWVRFQLGDGSFRGERLLSERSLAETHTPQMVIRLSAAALATYPEATQMSYALGWIVQDYRGQSLITHTGGTQGFRSRIVLVPRARLGIVLLTNSDVGTSGASMHLAASNALLDLIFHLPARDWNAYYTGLVEKEMERRRARRAALESKRLKGTKPSREPAAYAGSYREAAYGTATIVVENDALVLSWSSFKVRLEHFHLNTFELKGERLLAEQQAVFSLGANGDVESMQLLGLSFRKPK
jgi:CubicO group peptidase (beta-lactamase class C family)